MEYILLQLKFPNEFSQEPCLRANQNFQILSWMKRNYNKVKYPNAEQSTWHSVLLLFSLLTYTGTIK